MKTAKKLASVFGCALIIVAVFVGGGFTYKVTQDHPFYDVFYSTQGRKSREMIRIQNKLFPQSIGNYILYGDSEEKIEMYDKCGPASSDERCVQTINAQYRQKYSNKVVFVDLNKIIKGAEVVKSNLEAHSSKEVLRDMNIIRMEKAEIGWFPTSREFDFVLTRESTWNNDESGTGMSFSYTEKALGENPVTQYFMSLYPSSKF